MRLIGAIWGVVGIIALLGFAIARLTPYAAEALQSGLSIEQWLIAAVWMVFMIITEGYDGFYRRLAPRISSRAGHIYRSGDMIEIILAPLYCFGYFRAPLRRLFVSYVVIILIVVAVLLVQQIPQPWRGIIDIGVVAGLLYGVAAIILVSLRQRKSM